MAGTLAVAEDVDWTGAGGGAGVAATAGAGVEGGLLVDALEDGAALGYRNH